MIPLGVSKGATPAMMAGVLATVLTGSHFGFEASCLFEADGGAQDLGQTLVAIDHVYGSRGAFCERMRGSLMNQRG